MPYHTDTYQAVRPFKAYGQRYQPGDLVNTADWQSGVAEKLFNQRRMIPVAVQEAAPASKSAESKTLDGGVPDANVQAVLEWVGDDPERARLALAAEEAKEQPRKGVTEPTRAVIEAAEQPAEDPDSEAGEGPTSEDTPTTPEDGQGGADEQDPDV